MCGDRAEPGLISCPRKQWQLVSAAHHMSALQIVKISLIISNRSSDFVMAVGPSQFVSDPASVVTLQGTSLFT